MTKLESLRTSSRNRSTDADRQAAAAHIADYVLARANRSQPADRRYARVDQDQGSPDSAVVIMLANAE